jgi:hypothetical protein
MSIGEVKGVKWNRESRWEKGNGDQEREKDLGGGEKGVWRYRF